MSDMIERVARAIEPAIWDMFDEIKNASPEEREAYKNSPNGKLFQSMRQACEAIEAMREPTPEMIAANNAALKGHIDTLPDVVKLIHHGKQAGYMVPRDVKARVRWQAMIDEALK